MADPRLIHIALDEGTILAARPEIEGERQAAVNDLIADNRFAPCRAMAQGYEGPFRATLRVEEGRLAIEVADRDGRALETIMLGMARFRRPVRDYFAICDSYFNAVAGSSPAHIEPIDMARRALHNEGAELLTDCLKNKIDIDFPTARRLFTLVAALHIRG